MEDTLELIIKLFVCGVIIVAVLLGIILPCQWYTINFVDNIPSVVIVDGKEVYRGTSAGFNVQSSGYATTVVINGGFMYMFPQKVYTSKDVKIEGSK